ncbi:MAG: dihydropteroate synthase [Acidobacteria bacterium]|nr:dihydropteroate synthase [Acidobacteriota bacterium]
MGILNITPDSFFDGGRYKGAEAAVSHGVKMAEDGADILDVGGESTRPGAVPVTLEEELNRVIPVIAALKRETGLPISVDTCKSRVAAEAMDTGADIVNDISFGTFDDAMFTTVASGRAGYVGMHMQGTPGNMQKNPSYNDVVAEVRDFLQERAKLAIESGILPDKLAVDPGIGFGKNDEHNLALLQKLEKLQVLGYPVLVGASRKSMIGRLLGLDVEGRLSPSLAIALFAADKGVSVVRVHDVFETKQALKMWELLSE